MLRKPRSMSVARAASGIGMFCMSLQTSDVPVRRTRPMMLVSSGAESAMREGEPRGELLIEVARPRRGSRRAGAGLDQGHHGAGISTHRGGQAAGLDQDFAALPDAHHGAVDAREHFQHARQATDVLLLPAPLGEVAIAAAETDHAARPRLTTPACCVPASDSCHCDAASGPAGCWRCAAWSPACASRNPAPRDPRGARTARRWCRGCPPGRSPGWSAPSRCRT